MGLLPISKDLLSSDFRQKHRSLLNIRLRFLLVTAAVAYGLYFYGFIQNFYLILGFLGMAFVYSLGASWFIRREKAEVFFFTSAMVVDVLTLTLLVVSAVHGRTPLLTLYILYVLAIGLFFGFRVSLFPAMVGVIGFIGCSIWLTPSSWLTFLNISNLLVDTLWLGLLLFLVGLIAYHHAKDVWEKERVLAHREKELAALQNISSATRKMLPLEGLVHLVLTELVYGLRFDFGFLLLQEAPGEKIRLFHRHTGSVDLLLDQTLGFPFSSTRLPVEKIPDSFFRAITKKQTILHYKLDELMVGLLPSIAEEKTREFQKESGLKIFVGVPMIADRQVIGALVAGTVLEDLPKSHIVSLQKYANQAGLAIESAQRFVEIERKNVELEKANRAKSDFLATMSHELRTPLTAIIGFSELMLQDFMGPLSEEQRDAVSEVLNNAENLLGLINRILDFEKIEAGKATLELEEFELGMCVQKVERSTQSLVTKKKLRVQLDVQSTIPSLYADEKKVRQTLLNLLSNAIKFTPAEGRILVAARHLPHEDLVEVSVQDTGIGIAEKDREHLFKAFEQIDQSTTREYQGSGLGLALSKRFIEIQGGRIWVESEVGQGSKFVFQLPVRVTQTAKVGTEAGA